MVLPGQVPTPSQILSELLTGHLEAVSLQAEASYCQALALCSATKVSREFTAAQAARLDYDELRHRLEPRRRRLVHVGWGSLLLAGLGAGLSVLNAIEFSGSLSATEPALPALAAAAVWLTGAWLAALAIREKRWTLVAAVTGCAVVLALLLAALHGFYPRPGWPATAGFARGSSVFGGLISVFIGVFAVGAAVLMAHLEPASLFVARRRWHRARAAHQAAVQMQLIDVEMASMAKQAWLSLVRTQASTVAGDDERLVHETAALAAALLENGRPGFPAPLRIPDPVRSRGAR